MQKHQLDLPIEISSAVHCNLHLYVMVPRENRYRRLIHIYWRLLVLVCHGKFGVQKEYTAMEGYVNTYCLSRVMGSWFTMSAANEVSEVEW